MHLRKDGVTFFVVYFILAWLFQLPPIMALILHHPPVFISAFSIVVIGMLWLVDAKAAIIDVTVKKNVTGVVLNTSAVLLHSLAIYNISHNFL